MGGRVWCVRKRVLVVAALIMCLWGALQWPVHTRQGINGEVAEQRLPLYLKLGRFLYRDLEYRHLVGEVTRGVVTDEEKLLRLYDWVRAHIRGGIPRSLPVVDDHVWHIMIRGYGSADQLADVLATLCVYAGIPAELVMLTPPGQRRPVHAMAMVKLEGRWCPVDPYHGVIVRNAQQQLASREEILADPDLVRRIAPDIQVSGFAYADAYEWLPEIRAGAELRPYRHQPLRRAWYEMRRGLRRLAGAF
jgi:transglutaminase-like putative cysteine protease